MAVSGTKFRDALNSDSRKHQVRQSQKVKYFDGQARPKSITAGIDEVFEAQLSVMVIDIYFKDPEYPESARHYYSENQDPHSGGKDASDTPIWDAREYFLRILACRVGQIREEWNTLISQLLRHIDPFVDKIFAENSDRAYSNNQDLTQEEGYKWNIRNLRKFTNHHSKTIDIWESFNDGEIRYFFQPNSNVLAKSSYNGHLAEIGQEVKELIVLKKSLEHQTEMFENMTNSLATHAALAENRTLRRQSDYIQALTVLTIFYLPLNLTSSIYSTQSPILPEFVGLTDYICTLVGLTFATLVLVINIPHLKKLWEAL